MKQFFNEVNAVDKYEYKLKTEQMLELLEEGSYRKAAEIADTIDWKRVRNAAMLTNVSDIYEKNKEYQKSYEVLNLAYRRAEGSRKIISKLCTLAVKTRNVDEAIDYYDDFMQAAPKDPNQYILRYQILRAQRAPIEQQIEALEEYKKSEYIEEWAYELAKLYQEAGMTAECLEECDDLILWFSEGQYVYKAMELKMQYKPLTPSQQEKYDKRYEKLSSETEEMPDVFTYADSKTSDEHQDDTSAEDNRSAGRPDETDVPGLEEDVKTADAQTGKVTEKVSDAAGSGLGSGLKKKKIGDTMPLDEALRKLLHPEQEEKKEDTITIEPELGDLEDAIGEIESVVDVDMIKQITEEREAEQKKKRKTSTVAGEMREIVSPDTDQIDGQMSLEDILNDWEGAPKEEAGDVEDIEDIEDIIERDDIFEPEPEEIIEEELPEAAEEEIVEKEEAPEAEAAEIIEEEEALEAEAEEIVEEEEAPEAAAAEIVEEEEAPEAAAEEIIEEEEVPEAAAEEIIEEEEVQKATEEEIAGEKDREDEKIEKGEVEKETVDLQKTKKTEQILPPDIQRMIDEIEGVIPAEEENTQEPVRKPAKEEPRENMGKVADELRIDEASDLDDSGEEEYVEEDLIEEEEPDVSEELLEEDGELHASEDLLDEDEELGDGDEFFGEDKELADEDEFFGEDEEPADEDGFFGEDEELADEDEFFGEDEELADEDEFFGEDEELDDGDEFFGEDEELDDGEFFDEDDEAPDLDEEFRVNPEHADTPDDREIPDDDDDNMDILSATTPLSRKETAKMIATGKTAPLPLDEISDALSMTDTGFVVHGRYDLEMQSGIGTRAGLTEEQKKLFSYFVPVRGMSEQLVDVLEQDKNCTNRHGTSATGNLLIVGNKGNGKTVLAVDVVKAIQKQRNIRQGKVAIVTGDSLNKKKISDIFDKLYGGAIIIEKAGKMSEKTVARLNKAMEKDTGELLVVLEEQRKPIDRLLSSNREFRRKFTSRLEVPIFINDELVTFGQTYAQENGYRIDEMGILALYSKIDSLQREDHAVTVAEVKGIMDDAIQHSQKASAKKLVKRVFGKNTDEADRILLSEKDFNV